MRFTSYSKKEKAKNIKCPMHRVRITQQHIVGCAHFDQCFKTVGNSIEYNKKLMTEQRLFKEPEQIKNYIREVVKTEKQISGKVKETLYDGVVNPKQSYDLAVNPKSVYKKSLERSSINKVVKEVTTKLHAAPKM